MRRLSTRALLAGSSLGTVSFEEHEIAEAMDSEELAIEMGENEPEVASIETDIDDAAVLEEKAVALEELAETADGVTEATPSEVELVDLAANLAVAGTTEELEVFEAAEGEQVSVETFVGRRISTEGMKEMAKSFWEAIKALVARIWEKILGFWRRITDQVPALVKKAKALAQRAEDARGKALKEKGDKTKLGAEGRLLVVNDAAAKNAGDVLGGLKALGEVADTFLTKHAQRVQTGADAVAGKLAKFDLEKAEESLASINATGKLVMAKAEFSKMTAVTGDSRFGKDLKVLRSTYLPGNKAVFAQTLDGAADGSALGASQHIRSSGVSVMTCSEKPKEIKDFEVATFSPGDVDQIVDQIVALCEKVKAFNTKHLRGLETASGKVKKAGGDIASKIDDKTSIMATKCYNSAAQYHTAFAKWSSSPFTQLTSLILASCNAAIVASNKSLSQYKAD